MSTMTMFEAAKKYVDRGKSVIPIRPAVKGDRSSGKKPLLEWKEFTERLPTGAEIERWFKNTRNNIAIVTGRVSGLVVVDCDSEAGLQYATEHCDPTGVVCETGGGGRHLYYALPENMIVGNRARIEGLGLDLRGENGYVVCPPSGHWKGCYRWLAKGQMPAFNEHWLPEAKGQRLEEVVGDSKRKRCSLYLRKLPDAVPDSGTGDKNLFRAACICVQRFGLTQEEALEELRAFNKYKTGGKPWPEKRLIYKIEEATRLKRHTQI